jgi:hypothetical protein
MSDKTGIEWTDATWNPIAGCTPVSPGCLNCYAATMAYRLDKMGQQKYRGLTVLRNGVRTFNGKITTDEGALNAPLTWKKPRRVFVNSMSDLFHEDAPDTFLNRVFEVMEHAQRHTYQVLTKRAERMGEHPRNRSVALLAWSRAGRRARARGGAGGAVRRVGVGVVTARSGAGRRGRLAQRGADSSFGLGRTTATTGERLEAVQLRAVDQEQWPEVVRR